MAKRTFSDEQEYQIAQAYANGRNTVQLSDEYGVAVPTICNAIRRQGGTIRTFSDAKRKLPLDEHVFDVIDSEAPAYWYGLIWADGMTHGSKFGLGLKEADGYLVYALRDFFKTTREPKKVGKVMGDKVFYRIHLTINSVRLAQRLKALGIVPARESNFDPFSAMPPEFHNHFIRGLIDGDGCARTDGSLTICGSQSILERVRGILARDVGTSLNITVSKSKHANIYNFDIGGDRQARHVRDYLYRGATIWLTRKRERMDAWKAPAPGVAWCNTQDLPVK